MVNFSTGAVRSKETAMDAFVTGGSRSFITKLPGSGDSEGTFRSSSQATTCPPVYHTRRRHHPVFTWSRKAINANSFSSDPTRTPSASSPLIWSLWISLQRSWSTGWWSGSSSSCRSTASSWRTLLSSTPRPSIPGWASNRGTATSGASIGAESNAFLGWTRFILSSREAAAARCYLLKSISMIKIFSYFFNTSQPQRTAASSDAHHMRCLFKYDACLVVAGMG